MNDHARALVQAITGPIILITVGSLFALDKFSGWSFGQTWPMLIIVIGVLKLFGGSRKRLGNVAPPFDASRYAPPPPPPPPPPANPGPPYTGVRQ